MSRPPHRAVCIAGILILAGGCMPKGPEGLDSPVAQERMEAAVRAANRDDESAVAGLVTLLDSDDPAVRMVAIHSLEKITGQTMGYDYSAEGHERAEAIGRWKRYADELHAARSRAPGGAEDADR